MQNVQIHGDNPELQPRKLNDEQQKMWDKKILPLLTSALPWLIRAFNTLPLLSYPGMDTVLGVDTKGRVYVNFDLIDPDGELTDDEFAARVALTYSVGVWRVLNNSRDRARSYTTTASEDDVWNTTVTATSRAPIVDSVTADSGKTVGTIARGDALMAEQIISVQDLADIVSELEGKRVSLDDYITTEELYSLLVKYADQGEPDQQGQQGQQDGEQGQGGQQGGQQGQGGQQDGNDGQDGQGGQGGQGGQQESQDGQDGQDGQQGGFGQGGQGDRAGQGTQDGQNDGKDQNGQDGQDGQDGQGGQQGQGRGNSNGSQSPFPVGSRLVDSGAEREADSMGAESLDDGGIDDLKNSVANDAKRYKQAGNALPDSVQKWSTETLDQQVIDPMVFFNATVGGHLDYTSSGRIPTYSRRSRRQSAVSNRVILQGNAAEIKDLYVGIDVSGSMGDDELTLAMSAVEQLGRERGFNIYYFSVSTMPHGIRELQQGEKPVFDRDQAGTDMRMAFDVFAIHGAKTRMLITDSYTPWPSEVEPGTVNIVAIPTYDKETFDGLKESVPNFLNPIRLPLELLGERSQRRDWF